MPKPLSTLGTVAELDLTIPELKQEAAASSDASLARGKALLQRAQQAMGGADKLAAIKDVTLTARLNLPPAQGGSIGMTGYSMAGAVRQEQVLPFGKVVVFSDGKSGWISTPQGAQDMRTHFIGCHARGKRRAQPIPPLV